MTTTRTTKSITTKGGYEVAFKSYITGREYNDVEQVYLSGAKVSLVGNDAKIDGFSPTIEQDATKKLIEVMVTSVKGNGVDTGETVDPQTLLNAVLDLPYEDYVEIVSALNEVSGKKKAKP